MHPLRSSLLRRRSLLHANFMLSGRRPDGRAAHSSHRVVGHLFPSAEAAGRPVDCSDAWGHRMVRWPHFLPQRRARRVERCKPRLTSGPRPRRLRGHEARGPGFSPRSLPAPGGRPGAAPRVRGDGARPGGGGARSERSLCWHRAVPRPRASPSPQGSAPRRRLRDLRRGRPAGGSRVDPGDRRARGHRPPPRADLLDSASRAAARASLSARSTCRSLRLISLVS